MSYVPARHELTADDPQVASGRREQPVRPNWAGAHGGSRFVHKCGFGASGSLALLDEAAHRRGLPANRSRSFFIRTVLPKRANTVGLGGLEPPDLFLIREAL